MAGRPRFITVGVSHASSAPAANSASMVAGQARGSRSSMLACNSCSSSAAGMADREPDGAGSENPRGRPPQDRPGDVRRPLRIGAAGAVALGLDRHRRARPQRPRAKCTASAAPVGCRPQRGVARRSSAPRAGCAPPRAPAPAAHRGPSGPSRTRVPPGSPVSMVRPGCARRPRRRPRRRWHPGRRPREVNLPDVAAMDGSLGLGDEREDRAGVVGHVRFQVCRGQDARDVGEAPTGWLDSSAVTTACVAAIPARTTGRKLIPKAPSAPAARAQARTASLTRAASAPTATSAPVSMSPATPIPQSSHSALLSRAGVTGDSAARSGRRGRRPRNRCRC